MLAYELKLLQLEGICKVLDKHYLHINLLFRESIEVFWEVDETTAKTLEEAIDFDGEHKYRLSFNSSWDSVKGQYTNTVTRTYRDQSETIYFLSSEDYVNNLTTIKNIEEPSHLSSLTFIRYSLLDPDLDRDKEKKDEEPKVGIVEIIKTYINRPYAKPIVATSFVFIILFIYLGFGYLNKTISSRRVLAQPISLQDTANTGQDETDINPGGETEPGHGESNDSNLPEEAAIPAIKLNNTITYTIPRGSVALTFDDGPSRYTENIIDILNKYEVGGTFFFIGYNAKQYPDQIKAVVSSGYSVGSHSMNHAKLSKLSYENQKYELLQSVKLIEEIIDRDINFFRPAYGSYTSKITDLIKEHQYKMVLWDIDPRDWESRDPDKIFDYIKNADVSGSIILLHESQATVDALPRIIEYLQGLDLQIVNLE